MVAGFSHSNEHCPPALLLDAAFYETLAAARDLGSHGVTVTLASDCWVAPARWSRHVARTVMCPSSKDAGRFLAWLIRFSVAHPGHVIYPASDEVAWLDAARKEELSPYFKLYTQHIMSLVLLLDKARLHEEAKAAGLDVPETVVPRSEAEVERCYRELDFPLYVKPRTQMFWQGVGKGVCVNNPSELRSSWRAHLERDHDLSSGRANSHGN